MTAMFAGASFNTDVNVWDSIKVSSINAMFEAIASFNIDLSDWNIINVSYMKEIFESGASFNQ